MSLNGGDGDCRDNYSSGAIRFFLQKLDKDRDKKISLVLTFLFSLMLRALRQSLNSILCVSDRSQGLMFHLTQCLKVHYRIVSLAFGLENWQKLHRPT